MLRRCVVAASRLQQCHRLLQHYQPQIHSLAATRLPATWSMLPQLRSLHRGSKVLQQQQQDATSATSNAVTPPTVATGDRATDDVHNNEQIFDDGHEEKAYIAPSTTDSLVFNGIPYNELPIIHIKATYNNTHISVADHRGITVTRTSCGTEGFKNAKKGTAIAAQTAGIAAATKALDKGMNMVRVVIKGIGPGRQTSIKGLQMGGLDIISITDNTPVPHNGCRPRKARR